MSFEKQPKIENPAEQEKLEDAYKQDKGLWVPKEERGNVRSSEKFGVELSQADKDEKAREYEREADQERELIAQESKLKFTDKRAAWRESAETARQVKEVEEAKIPEKGMPVEEILKEVDIEKPNKSLEGAEKGFEKAKKTAEQKQETRKEKISSLSEAKKVGQERLAKAVEKFSDVLSYLFVPDKLAALGLKEGKKMAVENGKDLLAADLTPLSLIEQAVRRVFGFIQTEGAIRKRITGKEGLEVLRGMSVESRPEDYRERIAEFRSSIEKGGQQLLKGQEKIHKKGKLARLIEILQGEKK
jgi:hypothetical protein